MVLGIWLTSLMRAEGHFAGAEKGGGKAADRAFDAGLLAEIAQQIERLIEVMADHHAEADGGGILRFDQGGAGGDAHGGGVGRFAALHGRPKKHRSSCSWDAPRALTVPIVVVSEARRCAFRSLHRCDRLET